MIGEPVAAAARKGSRARDWTGDGAEWDARLRVHDRPAPLLQSSGWIASEIAMGSRVRQVELPSGAIAAVLVRGTWPLLSCEVVSGPTPFTAATTLELADWGRSQKYGNLRLLSERPPDAVDLAGLGFTNRPADHSGATLVVDLRPDEEMLASFKPRVRRCIRQAEQAGVEVTRGREAQVLAALTEETAARQRIYIPGRRRFETLLDNLVWCHTYVARLDGEPLAAALVAHFDGRAYYLFGGSTARRREVNAPHAAQWAAIRDAYDAGCRTYDFWGVPRTDDPAHPQHGLWLFKSGFNGRVELQGGAWDLVLNRALYAAGHQERRARVWARTLRDRLRGHRN